MSLRYILVTDGSSDRTLLPILNWVCREHFPTPIEGRWFDPRPFGPPSIPLKGRIRLSLELYPCDLLFIHRDAESEKPQKRYDEIIQAAASPSESSERRPFVCIVPVRMTEAWLLFNENAIRRAAGNPNGVLNLKLPDIKRVEQVKDPKTVLFTAFRTASELNARRLKKLNVHQCRLRVAELITDFSPLRQLDAFKRLEEDIGKVRLNLGRGC